MILWYIEIRDDMHGTYFQGMGKWLQIFWFSLWVEGWIIGGMSGCEDLSKHKMECRVYCLDTKPLWGNILAAKDRKNSVSENVFISLWFIRIFRSFENLRGGSLAQTGFMNWLFLLRIYNEYLFCGDHCAQDSRVNLSHYLASREKLCGEGYMGTLCTSCSTFL